ncbi:hypothetical protein MVES_001852 [Malassezia vespertilionis]|uniref:Cation-transporting ATPase n=1 Tax=Malassezia vespertilionis TaxID=2020962 RepID=A0A2N1JCM1_9BASI|nr:hypothetical protein MVES_001852 [Malassezia vespertilionis]
MGDSGAHRRTPPLELADERYQAPFQMRKSKSELSYAGGQPSSHSSFFDDKELRDAEAYVQGNEHDANLASTSVHANTSMRVRKRRDSQVGSYDNQNAVFDGPAAEIVPSSVSSMHHVMSRPSFQTYSRRQRERHMARSQSHGSQYSRSGRDRSPFSDRTQDSNSHSALSYSKRAYTRKVPYTDDDAHLGRSGTGPSIIGSLFAPFRGSEADDIASSSHHSSRWQGSLDGDSYDEDMELLDDNQNAEQLEDEALFDDGLHDEHGSDRSSTSSRRHGSPTNRFIPSVFGNDNNYFDNTSSAFYGHEEFDEAPFDDPAIGAKPTHLKDYPDGMSLLDSQHELAEPVALDHTAEEAQRYSIWLDKTCRSRQQIYLTDEDMLIRITGYRTRRVQAFLFTLASFLSLGIVALLALWLPKWKMRHILEVVDFADAEYVVVENQYGDVSEETYIHIPFLRPLKSVFPPSSMDPPCTYAQFQAMQQEPISEQSPEAGEAIVDLIMFEYRYARFALHPPSGRFRLIIDWRDTTWNSVARMRQGLKSDLEREREQIFGPNVIEIAAKSTWELLVGEVLHPFYIFQIVSILLWSLDDYYYYAFCIALISIGSIVSTLVETKRTISRLRNMSRFVCPVRVLRDGMWVMADSSELVPGDVYDAADAGLTIIPADSLLLSGDAIVNESMLTGESVPVSKQPMTDAEVHTLQTTHLNLAAQLGKHFLFAGTKVVRIRPSLGGTGTDDTSAKALVLCTGFHTTKGSLVRGMLFPKPMGFKFYRDSFRFIGLLGVIAFVGLCFNTVNFVKLGITWSTLLLRVLDLVTVVVPPALPATMSIGTAFAIVRLRMQGIFCISPSRVNVGGKVNVVCFDKTGTLTEDGLDVLGTRTVDSRTMQFSELHQETDEIPTLSRDPADPAHRNLILLHALATCHSLKVVRGEIIGDPLDVKMFEFTGWTVDEGDQVQRAQNATAAQESERPPALVQTVVRPKDGFAFNAEELVRPRHVHFLELGVIRTFDFVSALRRMSVIVKQLHGNSMEVYVKGAPEALVDICEKSSLPKDFDDLLSYYTQHGYRVIACAGKSIPNMTWVEAQRIPREHAESNLHFLGLVIFENKLKPDSAPAIATLRSANIGCKMVTGDNPCTAVSVARECGILGQSTSVYIPTFVQGSAQLPNDVVLNWTNTDNDRLHLNPDTLKPAYTDPLATDMGDLRAHEYELALTGDVFRWMTDYAPIEIVRRMLIKGTIFARMSPDEKHDLVDRLQDLGYTVAMCGDGANDCGALKAADIGISLSDAEASVAAPFTSTRPNISCVIEVIKEGRAALVTSFSCFKYMALYSLIQFTSITILYNLASSLGDFQFLYIDLFIILPVAVAMARTLPYPVLHTKRPTANLVSKKVIISMLTQVLINSAFQLFTFWLTKKQEWYEPPAIDPDELNVVNAENSAVFIVSSFQYIMVAAVFSVGPPFRNPIYKNPMLLLSLLILTCFSTFFLFVDSGFFFNLLGLVHFPSSFHWTLFVIVLVNAAMSFLYETYLMAPTLQLVKLLLRIHLEDTEQDIQGGAFFAK